jgi:AraC family ethanolamine operon transcriptional activator
MLFRYLAPSSALRLTTFADVDAFRPTELVEDARSVPLDVADFAAARAVVRLPACGIILTRSFARILDTAYRAPGGMVILSMMDDVEVTAKGMHLESHLILAMRGNDDGHFIEPKTNLHAMIIFSNELADRSWFDRPDKLQAFAVKRAALLHAREFLLGILRTAAAEPQLFEQAEVARHLQEGLLLAFDELFRVDPSSPQDASTAGERPLKLVRLIDDFVAANPASPVYTASLAGEFGVSMRTLGSAVAKVRGMSLHQYIRLRKLWTIRTLLLKGGAGMTVASCARANGFHHMGEFAAAYRTTFRETPSETLARGRSRTREVTATTKTCVEKQPHAK